MSCAQCWWCLWSVRCRLSLLFSLSTFFKYILSMESQWRISYVIGWIRLSLYDTAGNHTYLLFLRGRLHSPAVFGGVRVAHPFSFLCCVFFCFVCPRPVSCVPGVASFSASAILDCPVGFLWRLFIFILYYTFIACCWGKYENLFTQEYHISRGQGEYDTLGWINFHISWTRML